MQEFHTPVLYDVKVTMGIRVEKLEFEPSKEKDLGLSAIIIVKNAFHGRILSYVAA